MLPMQQEDIHLLARHSNWPAAEVDQALKKNVYQQRDDWQKFLRLFVFPPELDLQQQGSYSSWPTTGPVCISLLNWDSLQL